MKKIFAIGLLLLSIIPCYAYEEGSHNGLSPSASVGLKHKRGPSTIDPKPTTPTIPDINPEPTPPIPPKGPVFMPSGPMVEVRELEEYRERLEGYREQLEVIRELRPAGNLDMYKDGIIKYKQGIVKYRKFFNDYENNMERE